MPDVSVDELRKSFQTKCLEQKIFTDAKLSKNGQPVITSNDNFGRTTFSESNFVQEVIETAKRKTASIRRWTNITSTVMSNNKFVKSFSKQPKGLIEGEFENEGSPSSNINLQVPVIRMADTEKDNNPSVPFYRGTTSNLKKKNTRSVNLSTSRVHFETEHVNNGILTKSVEFTEVNDKISDTNTKPKHPIQTSYYLQEDSDMTPPSLSPNKPVNKEKDESTICSLINDDLLIKTDSPTLISPEDAISSLDRTLVTPNDNLLKFSITSSETQTHHKLENENPEKYLSIEHQFRTSIPFIEGYNELTNELAIRASKCNTTPIKLIDSTPKKLSYTHNLNNKHHNINSSPSNKRKIPHQSMSSSIVSASTEIFENC